MKNRSSGESRVDAGAVAQKVLPWVLLAVAVCFFIWHARNISFIQDDSYITYRYARNIVRGVGPVFNPGERVEGYTNFLWMMIIAGLGIIGIPWNTIIPLTQILGLLCGVGVLLSLFFLVRRHTAGPPWLAPLVLLPLAANGAFAYWCVSGMETGLFSLLLAVAAVVYLGGSTTRRLLGTSVLLGLSALTRPEGALFFCLFLLHFALGRLSSGIRQLFSRDNLVDLLWLVAPFVLLVAPLYAWRLSYYGSLFPNTFYAKTGLSSSYLKSGIQYYWEFLKAYGLWGFLLLVPPLVALLRRRLSAAPTLFAGLVLLIYSAYIIAVGGDVLRIYRFFVPVLFLFYFLVAESVWLVPMARAVQALILLVLIPYSFIGPFAGAPKPRAELERISRASKERFLVIGQRADILWNRFLENGLVDKMSATGRWLNAHIGEDDWFACTTIGAVSFYADRNMVDMLGLTDSTVARHPEHILGQRVYWKERNYNTRHVLELNPSYIYFSTGSKPSAAAERALFLRARFRRGYFPTLITPRDRLGPFTEVLYQSKPGADTIPLEAEVPDPEFVDLFNQGINLNRSDKTLDSAVKVLYRCAAAAPPDFAQVWEWIGQTYVTMRREDLAQEALERAVAVDDYSVTAHEMLGAFAHKRRDYVTAAEHFARLVQYSPGYMTGYINLAAAAVGAGDYSLAERVLSDAIRLFPDQQVLKNRLYQLKAANARSRQTPAGQTRR